MLINLRYKISAAIKDATFRNVLMTISVRILAAVFGLALQILLARTMVLGEYGVYVILWTWISIANQIGVFGFTDSSSRFVPKYTKRMNSDHLKSFYKTGFSLVLVGASTLGILGIMALILGKDWLQQSFYLPALIIMIGMPFLSIESYLNGVARGLGAFMLATVPAFILRPLLIMIAVVIAWFNNVTVDATFVFTTIVAVTAGVIIYQALYIRALISSRVSTKASSTQKRFWVLASLSLMPAMIADEVFFWCDVLFLGVLATPEEASIYFAAQRSLSLAAFVQFAFMLVAARNFSISNASADKVELQRQITTSTNATLLLTIPSVLLTLGLGYPLLYLFGPDFLAAYPAMIILGVAYILRALTGQAPDLLIVLGKHHINLIVSSLSVIVCFVCMWILVPHIGINGAAYSMAIVYILRAAAFTFLTKRETGYWVLATPNLK